ncbi:type II toxin-antitoxin system Phd/YefM family antitoxin [Alkalimarinus coralli]|uniref:type II toxin-antitoxin system Phd/YefM family antitoxin n=1 Tax=Alkalimarinus coralli TaxID=2935863 RepID=UPI00202AD64D|nr:type II toxin-antitoxin system Phd/YefM family antitoxin [Alkalimarinus coralli]
MRIYTYSEARQNLSELLSLAENEEVVIQRRDGKTFTVNFKQNEVKSPFDVSGINTKATTKNILDAVEESRKL